MLQGKDIILICSGDGQFLGGIQLVRDIKLQTSGLNILLGNWKKCTLINSRKRTEFSNS